MRMQLVVVRHAIAMDREEFARTGKDDALRPLTREGRKRMARAASGLRRLVPELSRVVTSPLLRALQTAEILAAQLQCAEPEQLALLSPERPPKEAAEWLAAEKSDLVAIVGHEPHLGLLVSRLLTGVDGPSF